MKKIILAFLLFLVACLTVNAQKSTLSQVATDKSNSVTPNFLFGEWQLQNPITPTNSEVIDFSDDSFSYSTESLIAPPETPAEIDGGDYSLKQDKLILKISDKKLKFKIIKLSENKFSLLIGENSLTFAKKFSQDDKFFVNYQKEAGRLGYRNSNNHFGQIPFWQNPSRFRSPKQAPPVNWCSQCGGTGICHECLGLGKDELNTPCDNCNGTGKCPICEGAGRKKPN